MCNQTCSRCGIDAQDTVEGFLAYNGSRLVCADCDSDLNTEWHADNPGSVNPLDTLNPVAHVLARLAA